MNAICPGAIQTPMLDRYLKATPGAQEAMKETEPIGRFGTPDEIANARAVVVQLLVRVSPPARPWRWMVDGPRAKSLIVTKVHGPSAGSLLLRRYPRWQGSCPGSAKWNRSHTPPGTVEFGIIARRPGRKCRSDTRFFGLPNDVGDHSPSRFIALIEQRREVPGVAIDAQD